MVTLGRSDAIRALEALRFELSKFDEFRELADRDFQEAYEEIDNLIQFIEVQLDEQAVAESRD